MSAKSIILKEIEKYNKLIIEYNMYLSVLPRGSISTKKINNKEYYYLKYREGKKIKTDYIGNDSTKINDLIDKIKQRTHIENMIKTLKLEINNMEKIIKTL